MGHPELMMLISLHVVGFIIFVEIIIVSGILVREIRKIKK